MREKMKGSVFILLLFLCLAAFYSHASAAEVSGVKKTAYVDSDSKSLYLQFESFSKKAGYNYVLSTGDRVIAQGIAKQDSFYPLGGYYKAGGSYELKIQSEDGKVLTVRYYVRKGIKSYRASEVSGKIRHSWLVSSKKAFSGFDLDVIRDGQAVEDLFATVSGGAKNSVITEGTGLKTGTYRARLIAWKTINKKKYYSQVAETDLTYIRPPKKVKGLKADPGPESCDLSWESVPTAAYYRVFQSASLSGSYRLVKDRVNANSCTVKELEEGKQVYFKVQAVARYKSRMEAGQLSRKVSCRIPQIAGQVKEARVVMEEGDQMRLKWKKTLHADTYHVYCKTRNESEFKLFAKTKKRSVPLTKLAENTDYYLKVYAVTSLDSGEYVSPLSSAVVKVNPVRDVDKILASGVETIRYVNGREVFTRKKYTERQKTAFVNYKGYSSSSKYLIWISCYTQEVSIFKGKKGSWRMIRHFPVATGKASARTPRGVFKIGKKEKGWFYSSTKILYVTHFYKKASFHTRPLYYSGNVATSTIGQPASHGCVRCPNDGARFIYNKIPAGTTVASY